MSELQLKFLKIFALTTAITIFLHNFAVSLIFVVTRPQKLPNALKSVFNISGAGRLLIDIFETVLLLNSPSLGQCRSLGILFEAFSFLYRESLDGLLLWRICFVTKSIWDTRIAIFLFFLKSMFQTANLVTRSPVLDNIKDRVFCIKSAGSSNIPTVGFVTVDFIILIYITIRFLQTLSSRSHSQKRQYVSIISWNFVFLFISGLMFVLVIVSLFAINIDALLLICMQVVLCILVSDLVTYDADFVKLYSRRL